MAVGAWVRFLAGWLSLLLVVGPSLATSLVDSFCDSVLASETTASVVVTEVEAASDELAQASSDDDRGDGSSDDAPDDVPDMDDGGNDNNELVEDDVCDIAVGLKQPVMNASGWFSHSDGSAPDRVLSPPEKVA